MRNVWLESLQQRPFVVENGDADVLNFYFVKHALGEREALQSCIVFSGCDDIVYVGCNSFDAFEVVGRKIVVIGKEQRVGDAIIFRLEVCLKRLRMSNAGEKCDARFFNIVKLRHGSVIHRCEEKLLRFSWFQLLADGLHLLSRKTGWTLSNDDDVGTLGSLFTFAKSPPRDDVIRGVETAVVGEEDATRRTNIAVLKSIVKHDDVKVGMLIQKVLNPFASILANGNYNVTIEMLIHL